MEKKQVKITAPEGFHFTGEVTNSEEGNTIAVVFEEDKSITWRDIINKATVSAYFDANTLHVANYTYYKDTESFTPDVIDMRNRMIAYCKLMIIAKYFNGDWKPKLNSTKCIVNDCFTIGKTYKYIADNWVGSWIRGGLILFKDKESCEKAIRIMGEELDYLFNY